MSLIKIPKKSGGFREIYICPKDFKAKNRAHLPYLNKVQLNLCDNEIVHGFIKYKSSVTNVMAHRFYRYTLSFDLKNFFDTVTIEMIKDIKNITGEYVFTQDTIDDCFINGRAYQGIPTSPIVANLAAINLDKKIKKACNELGNITYTRYADDLSFSFNDRKFYEQLKNIIPQIIESEGFITNERKTRLQDGKYFDRIITGVLINSFRIKIPRKTRRKLRAALHKPKNSQSGKGLLEWSKLKMPKVHIGEITYLFNDKDIIDININAEYNEKR